MLVVLRQDRFAIGISLLRHPGLGLSCSPADSIPFLLPPEEYIVSIPLTRTSTRGAVRIHIVSI